MLDNLQPGDPYPLPVPDENAPILEWHAGRLCLLLQANDHDQALVRAFEEGFNRYSLLVHRAPRAVVIKSSVKFSLSWWDGYPIGSDRTHISPRF
jgi:hypothetical protein